METQDLPVPYASDSSELDTSLKKNMNSLDEVLSYMADKAKTNKKVQYHLAIQMVHDRYIEPVNSLLKEKKELIKNELRKVLNEIPNSEKTTLMHVGAPSATIYNGYIESTPVTDLSRAKKIVSNANDLEMDIPELSTYDQTDTTKGGKSHHRKKSKSRSKSKSKSRGKSRKRSKSRGKSKRK